MITYENKWIQVAGPVLDVKLPSVGPVSFRLRGRYIGEGFDSGDSPYFAGMRDRDSSFWLGAAAIWRTGIANFSAEVLTDAMSNSGGCGRRCRSTGDLPQAQSGWPRGWRPSGWMASTWTINTA